MRFYLPPLEGTQGEEELLEPLTHKGVVNLTSNENDNWNSLATPDAISMIRKREEKDNDEILNIWFKASSMAHPFLASEFVEKAQEDLRTIYIPATETWIYEENASVIGFISMLGNEIGGLFVLPDRHSKGIGTQLVNFIHGLQGDLEVEVFEKNAIGRAFYEKYGFIETNRYHHAESNNVVLRLLYTTERLVHTKK